jgi:rod shape-determining protein MreD
MTSVPVRVRLGVVVFVALVAQLSVVNRLSIGGVTADLLVVGAVAAGFVAGPERGAAVGFAAGLGFDLLLSTPLGLTALVYTVVGYASGIVASNLIRDSRLTAFVLAAIAAPAATGAWVLIGALFGQTHLLHAPLVRIAVANAVLAVVTLPLMLGVVRRAVVDPYDRVRQRA